MHIQLIKEPLKKFFTIPRGITSKRVASGRVYLRGLAPKLSSEETLQRWKADGDTVSDFAGPGIEPQTSCTNSNILNYGADQPSK